MTASEHELMRRLRFGDVAAFEELVARWQRPLSRVLRRLSGGGDSISTQAFARNGTPHGATNGHWAALPDGDVDDLAQEVFLRVYLARDRYRPVAEFSTWLYRIALNVVRDAARKRRRRPRVSLNGQPHDVDTSYGGMADNGSDAVPADQPLERRERNDLVSAALSRLPDQLREPLVLRHFAELTFPQIANVLKTPETTIKSRVQTALERLEGELRRAGLDATELES